MKIDRSGKASILTPNQINLLFSEGFSKSRDKALFGICLYTAARINEACTLNYRDIIGANGVRSVMIIRAVNTKGKLGTREIQVHPQLKAYLNDYIPEYKVRGKNPHLFPGRHGLGHIHKASADAILRSACNKLGIEGVSTHSFRRTALTTMSDSGIPLRHIQDISGHRTLAALERYLGVTDEQKENAIATLVF
jgi:integrase/recombinase XerD